MFPLVRWKPVMQRQGCADVKVESPLFPCKGTEHCLEGQSRKGRLYQEEMGPAMSRNKGTSNLDPGPTLPTLHFSPTRSRFFRIQILHPKPQSTE